MDLSDFLPESVKHNFANRNLKIGAVLKLHVEDTNPPKVKRFIVVGFDSDNISLATVYINSEVNFTVNFSEELRKLQISFKSEGREYLDHDSFVDCSKLQFRNVNELRLKIKSEPVSIIGQLAEDDLMLIKSIIIKAKTIKGKYKKRYGFYD